MLQFQFLVFRARHLRRPLLQLRRLHLREHETKVRAAVFCHFEVYSGDENERGHLMTAAMTICEGQQYLNLCRVPELEFLTQEHESWKWLFR